MDGLKPGAEHERPLPAAKPQLWQQVVEQLGTAVAVIDSAGRIAAVNPAAEQLLGRAAATMCGQDLHDLCHRDPGGARIPRERCPLLRALAEGRSARGDDDRCLRGDGRLVPVSWSTSPLTDDDVCDVSGVVQGMVVLIHETAAGHGARQEQAERVEQRERAEQAEQAARTSALESLAERLTLVAEITDVLGQTLEVDEALARLSRLLVPRLADWAVVDLLVGPRQVHRVAVTGPEGRDAGQEDWQGQLPPPAEESARSPLVQVLHGAGPVVQDRADLEVPPDSPPAAVHSAFLKAAGAASVITVPLGTRRQVTGALTLVRTDPARPFGTGDVDVASDIGRRVGLVIDNARRFGRQRAVAEAMQRNLLPPLPEHGRIQLAARYQPAPAGSQVGGDWYDAFTLRDGTLALVIGDVVGHDLTAAAGMAQLHGILRSLAWDRTEPTGAIVDRLDTAMHAITSVSMATLVLARVEGPDTGPWTLRWTSAGHPPPLLLTPDGNAQYLEAGQGLILGTHLDAGGHRPSAAHVLPPGSTLLLYTDGLIEVPGSDLDSGLGRLRRHALALAHEPLETLCDQLSARMPPGSTDDIALLALRLPEAETTATRTVLTSPEPAPEPGTGRATGG
ncbi:SpoIIE family protein phosphatase [Streptomyces broussonetiae]|uniref:protein-serine/threonine phosphatase n=1 Tax=Streptomyces broussonetiae TaxID=2686304 RepID=A0A6I6NC73_9ACTN|nr:SpoIIE family protein phosphatase [Streptomyces broussonetiae]QHA05886.1 SpoIIE family protein phosphatase [Streptomyces broussonetiae]